MFLKSSGLNAHVQEAVPPERPTRESPQHRPHWGRAFIWGAHSSQCPVSQVTLKATGWEGHSAQWLPHKHGGRAAGAPQALQGLQGPPPGPSQPPRPGRDAGRHQWGDSRHCRDCRGLPQVQVSPHGRGATQAVISGETAGTAGTAGALPQVQVSPHGRAATQAVISGEQLAFLPQP